MGTIKYIKYKKYGKEVYGNMRNKMGFKSLVVLLMLSLVLVVAGCGNKAEEKNAEDKGKIEAVEKKVASLFNEDKTDLAKDINDELIEDVTNAVGEVNEDDLSDDNKKLFLAVVKDKDLAFDLISLENRVKELVDEDGNINETELGVLNEQLNSFKDKEVDGYFKRVSKKLDEFESIVEEEKKLAKHVKKTDKAFDKLYNDKDKLKENVSKEDLKDIKELVGKIDDKETSLEYEKKLKKLELDVEKKEKKAEKKKEKKAEVNNNKTSNKQTKSNNNSKTTVNKSNQSNNSSQSKGSSSNGKQVASNSSGGKSTSGGNSGSKATTNNGGSKGTTSSNNSTSKPQPKPEPKPEPKPQPKPQPEPKPEYKEVRFSKIGNSGMEFKTGKEAEDWANKVWNDPKSKWYDYSSWHGDVVFYGYKDANGNIIKQTRMTYTIDFYK